MNKTWDPENVKFPPDCNSVVNHSFTDKVNPWFTMTIFESNNPRKGMADGGLAAIEVMEVNVIDAGAKYKRRAIGIGGPFRGCFLQSGLQLQLFVIYHPCLPSQQHLHRLNNKIYLLPAIKYHFHKISELTLLEVQEY